MLRLRFENQAEAELVLEQLAKYKSRKENYILERARQGYEARQRRLLAMVSSVYQCSDGRQI